MRSIIGSITILLVAGCGHIPFEETRYVPMENADPVKVVQNYENELPQNFQLLDSVVIEYNWKKFSGIGFIEINKRESTYAIAFLNPMGVKLFELTGGSEGVNSCFVPGEFKGREAIARSIGEDIKRIYFDVVPSLSADTEREKFKLVFRNKSGPGVIKYVFAGPEGRLVEKSYYEDDRLGWKVSYYEYKRKDGRIYPGGIIYNNYLYGYSLTFTLKEVLD